MHSEMEQVHPLGTISAPTKIPDILTLKINCRRKSLEIIRIVEIIFLRIIKINNFMYDRDATGENRESTHF